MKNYFSIAEVKDYTDILTFHNKFKENNKSEKEVEWEDSPLETLVYDISTLKNIAIKNKNISFFKFKIFTERKKSIIKDNKGNLLPRDERINKIESQGLVFHDSGKIKIVFLCGIENISKFKKDLFNKYTKLDSEIYFDEDILFWLFWHHEQNGDKSLSDDEDIFINDLRTYTGVSQDNKNEIKVDGDKASTLLATLGSIFSSKKFKLLNLELDYLDENITVEIRNSGTYKLDIGSSKGDCDRHGVDRTFFLLIFVDIYVFPKIKNSYKKAIENNVWNELIQLSYTKQLGVKIINLVNEGLALVERELKDKSKENSQRLFHEKIVKK